MDDESILNLIGESAVQVDDMGAVKELTDKIKAALAEARREERMRVVRCFDERLKWEGDGYVWSPSREDYREDPGCVVLRALDGEGA